MADLINPYANPYLPSFVNQRPVINNQSPNVLPTPQMNYSGIQYGQIHSVKGFAGARAYNLANGASEILADEDPNVSRVYIVAKDANGQLFIQGGDFVPIEEPKPVTMDDISTKMNQILERLNKLEGEKRNDQSGDGTAGKGGKQSGNAGYQSNDRNASVSTGSSKRSEDAAGSGVYQK